MLENIMLFIYALIIKGLFNDEVDPMFFSILWSYSSGDHPWVYLTKFDDIQNMKEENLDHPFIL